MIATFKERLLERQEVGNLRSLQIVENLVDFSSNDYLGLARSPALDHQHEKYGSTGSRLLTGHSASAQKLEEKIAAFHGYAAGLIFNCGYMANVGLLSTVAVRGDCILFDAQIHASMRDGIRLSRAEAFPFRHNDLEHLKKRLETLSLFRQCFICIESIYSTDGSLAPLEEISRLAEYYGAHLIVDEAHAVGVMGPQGRGLVSAKNLNSQVFAQVVTFGKALGVQGAVVLGSTILRELLINFATSFIYTTALPPYALAAINASYDLFPTLDCERKHLNNLIHHFKASQTHIQPFFVPGNVEVKRASQELMSAGFDVRPLTSPTVQRGDEMLRVSLHAFNSVEEIKKLKSILKCADRTQC